MGDLNPGVLEGLIDFGPELGQRRRGGAGPQGVAQEAIASRIFDLGLALLAKTLGPENTSRTYVGMGGGRV